MQVAFSLGSGKFDVSETARPDLLPGEALVRVVAAGICGSDKWDLSRLPGRQLHRLPAGRQHRLWPAGRFRRVRGSAFRQPLSEARRVKLRRGVAGGAHGGGAPRGAVLISCSFSGVYQGRTGQSLEPAQG